MKVLHGMSEVAGQGSYSVKGLKENGIDAKMAVWRENPFGYEYDYNLNIGKNKLLYPYYGIKMIVFALFAICKFDCFHFHFGWSLLPGGMDLRILRLFRKKVFMEFHGSDIRWSFNREEYKGLPLPPDNEKRKKKILKIMKYVDGIILHDEELRKHLPQTKVPVYIVPLRVDLKRFTPCYPETEKVVPRIVHAPSKRGFKGTEYVLQAINNLSEKFEFVLVENKSQEEAFEIYKTADIIVDQLMAGTYGVFSIEAMALGKPVITYINEEMLKTFPEELPILSAVAEDLEEKLKILLQNVELRKEKGIIGRKYVEKYHDYRKNACILEQIYRGDYLSKSGKEAFTYINSLNVD